MPHFKLTRDFYIPQGYALIESHPEHGVEVFAQPLEDGRVLAMLFAGKRSKPDWHIRFKTSERLRSEIDQTLASLEATAERKAIRKAERTAPHDVKVGDVFKCSWGYEQTNVDYYEVTKVTGSMVEITPIAAVSESTAWMQGECAPAPGQYIGEPIRKRVNLYGKEPYLTMNSFSSASRLKPTLVAGVKVYPVSSWSSYY